MSKLTLDATLPEKLRTAQEPVAICDEAGEQLGKYIPLTDKERKAFAWLRKHVTSEDLDRLEAEPGPCRTLDEILRELRPE